MLQTNPFVVVISLDFSKAFDTVRHSTLLTNMAELDLPLPVYNWLVSFFDGHTHTVLCIMVVSLPRCRYQPVLYKVPVSDHRHSCRPQASSHRQPVRQVADDTYLVVPAGGVHTRALKLDHIANLDHASIMQKETEIGHICLTPKSKSKNWDQASIHFTREQQRDSQNTSKFKSSIRNKPLHIPYRCGGWLKNARRKGQLNLAHGTQHEKIKNFLRKTKNKHRVAQKKRSRW